MKTSTLAPGLLVSLKTTLSGNVQYRTTEIEAEHEIANGARKARWEGERLVEIPDEHKRGIEARSAARACITRVCSLSSFGLICREDRIPELDQGVIDAQRLVDKFNETAKLSRLTFSILTGRIANDDAQAARAIAGEVRELIEEMAEKIADFDVDGIRKAAKKAQDVGRVLTDAAKARVQEAVDAARATATKINKAGEQAAQAIDTAALDILAAARTSFLDLDGGLEVQAPEEVGRGVDYEPAGSIITVGVYDGDDTERTFIPVEV